MTLRLLANDIAHRVPAMSLDSINNNEDLIMSLIQEWIDQDKTPAIPEDELPTLEDIQAIYAFYYNQSGKLKTPGDESPGVNPDV